jgi:hypothetical protein
MTYVISFIKQFIPFHLQFPLKGLVKEEEQKSDQAPQTQSPSQAALPLSSAAGRPPSSLQIKTALWEAQLAGY